MMYSVVKLEDILELASDIETMAKAFGSTNATEIKELFFRQLRPCIFGVDESNLPVERRV